MLTLLAGVRVPSTSKRHIVFLMGRFANGAMTLVVAMCAAMFASMTVSRAESVGVLVAVVAGTVDR